MADHGWRSPAAEFCFGDYLAVEWFGEPDVEEVSAVALAMVLRRVALVLDELWVHSTVYHRIASELISIRRSLDRVVMT